MFESAESFLKALGQRSAELGFAAVSVLSVAELEASGKLGASAAAFHAWLESGFSAGMAYLKDRETAFSHPKFVLPEVRSIIVLGMTFPQFAQITQTLKRNPQREACLVRQPSTADGDASLGRVAHYAESGYDYHEILRPRLRQLQAWLKTDFPQSTSRGTVDTAPLHERELARWAGLGFRGRNRMLIHPQYGSELFLATVLTSANLPEFRAFPEAVLQQYEAECAACGRCLAACPTGALSERGVDARRCLSYLTIEHREPIPEALRQKLSGRAFGCDACQDACPHNQNHSHPEAVFLRLSAIQNMTADEFHAAFAHSPFLRSGQLNPERRSS